MGADGASLETSSDPSKSGLQGSTYMADSSAPSSWGSRLDSGLSVSSLSVGKSSAADTAEKNTTTSDVTASPKPSKGQSSRRPKQKNGKTKVKKTKEKKGKTKDGADGASLQTSSDPSESGLQGSTYMADSSAP